VIWNGRADRGAASPSGQYFARLAVDGVYEVIKLSLVHDQGTDYKTGPPQDLESVI
jgi:hypothetical protein